MSAHDVFTGSAGGDRSTSAGWTHTADIPHGAPERRAAARAQGDAAFPWVWLLITVACLCVLAAITKPVLELLLRAFGLWP